MSKTVFIAVPNRGSVAFRTAIALLTPGKTPIYSIRFHSSSILTFTFNCCWKDALNERGSFTHFVMIHDDIQPMQPGWLDTLCDEYDRCGADVLSAVSPIKDKRGLTSTAFLNPKTRKTTRLTMTEAVTYPPTFGGEEAGKPGQIVLPNTGLWICDFRKPWVEKICFTMRDRIFQSGGQWLAQCFSEDWDFGLQCHALGVKVMATTAVKLCHAGEFDYPNFEPWGVLKNDDQVNTWNPPNRFYGETP